MSEDSFNSEKFVSDLKERLSQPLPEVVQDNQEQIKRIYLDLVDAGNALKRVLKKGDGVIAITAKTGDEIRASERNLLDATRKKLLEQASLMLRKIKKDIEVIFKPPFNFIKDGIESAESTDTDERFASVEHEDLKEQDFKAWEQIIKDASSVVGRVASFKERLMKPKSDYREKSQHEIKIFGALNPYREGFLDSGIPDIVNNDLAAERRDVVLGLEEILAENQQYYMDMGLPDWAENIGSFDLNLTSEKIETIRQEVASGAVLIFMPNKITQLATTTDQIKKACKPRWVDSGREQAVLEADLWDGVGKLVDSHSEVLVIGIPEKPYISLMKPSRRSEARTFNKTVFEQFQELSKINEERAQDDQVPVSVTNLFEFVSLQIIFGEQLKEKLSNIGKPLTILPLNYNTTVRFTIAPLSNYDEVLSGSFNPGAGQTCFSVVDAQGAYDLNGVRFSVRVGN